ncbi:MAG: efflux RND transporter periplasmic adaptor subunit [Candidatus Woesebacteria bacterium]|nr:MAG: efflux RND transporter periplasmic adaptor subunit [Candidatus Woesebacteria bacterium]
MEIIINFLKRLKGTRRRNKIIVIIVILIALFFVLRGRAKKVPLQYATVSKNNIESRVSASGILNGKKSVSLHFAIAGKLNYLGVSIGDNVSKGQTIAALDNTDLNSALQTAINNRRNTQAAVENIHDQVKDHSSDETFSQKATRTASEVANDNAWASLLAAERDMQNAVIYSPFSGVVVNQASLNPGQNITTTDLIAQMVDFSQKDFDATVDESDIGQVQIGQSANVTLNAYGDTVFSGKVVEIDPQTQTSSTGAIAVIVKIEVGDSRIAKIYGLNGNADIITSSKKDVLIIPQDALIDDSHVYVNKGTGITEKREIKIGIKSDTDVEVISGLSEGEQVIINPQAISK